MYALRRRSVGRGKYAAGCRVYIFFGGEEDWRDAPIMKVSVGYLWHSVQRVVLLRKWGAWSGRPPGWQSAQFEG